MEDFDQFVTLNEVGLKFCGICLAYSTRKQADLRDHIESKHFPNAFSYTCQECGMVMNTNKAYKNHKFKKHRNISEWSFHFKIKIDMYQLSVSF